MTTAWLIRHGQTATSGRCYAGRADVPLSPEGIRQAEAIAQTLAHQPLDAILSSPLQRAMDTAGPLADLTGCKITPMPDLMEFDFGDLEGRSKSEIAVSIRKAHLVTPVPGGESLMDLWIRTFRVVRRVSDVRPCSCVAIVGHYWTNRLLYGHFNRLTMSEAVRCRAYRPETGSVFSLDFDPIVRQGPGRLGGPDIAPPAAR